LPFTFHSRCYAVGFETAKKRSNRLCSVEKSNVLEVSQLWKEVVCRVHQEEFPEVGRYKLNAVVGPL
jgi:3-isopropylmalate dehydrogenase